MIESWQHGFFVRNCLLTCRLQLVSSWHVGDIHLQEPCQVESDSEGCHCDIQVHVDGDEGCSQDEKEIQMGHDWGRSTWVCLAKERALDVHCERLIIKDIVTNLEQHTTEDRGRDLGHQALKS